MYFPEDWAAAMDSEIFREYASNELQREASEAAEKLANKLTETEQKVNEELEAHAALDDLQAKINANPKLREHFKKCLAELNGNPDLRKKVDSKFIHGLELLEEIGALRDETV